MHLQPIVESCGPGRALLCSSVLALVLHLSLGWVGMLPNPPEPIELRMMREERRICRILDFGKPNHESRFIWNFRIKLKETYHKEQKI